MDRAGLVGADGATHCGAFDVTYMACIPNMVVMAPSNEAELINMVATAAAIDDRPSCFRFPRGNGLGLDLAEYGITPDLKGRPLEVRGGVDWVLTLVPMWCACGLVVVLLGVDVNSCAVLGGTLGCVPLACRPTVCHEAPL